MLYSTVAFKLTYCKHVKTFFLNYFNVYFLKGVLQANKHYLQIQWITNKQIIWYTQSVLIFNIRQN